MAGLQILGAARRWAGKGMLAIADQGLIAASNFLVAIILARQLRADQYGAWALAFEVFLLLAILYSSFILEPMSVFGPANYKDMLPEYLGTILRLHGWVAVATVFVLSVAASVANQFSGSQALAQGLAGVALAGPCVLLFWVARRTFYLELNPGPAVWGAAVYSAVLLAGLGICYRLHALSPFSAFLIMAIAALATSPALLIRLRPSFKASHGLPSAQEILSQHWKYGRWALASSSATWGTTAVLFILLTSFRGLSATGEMKALLNLASPIGTAFVAISMLSVPYGSRIHRNESPEAMMNFAGRLTVFYMGGTAAYFAVLMMLRQPVMHLLYGHKYADVAGLVPWIGLAMVLRIGATAQAIPLRALQTPSLVFAAYGGSFLVAVAVGVPATWAYGLTGTVLAYSAGSGSAVVLAYILLRRKLHAKETQAELLVA